MQECKAGARGCVQCKKQLIENINKHLEPIRDRRHYYEEHPDEVKEILMAGTEKGKSHCKRYNGKSKEINDVRLLLGRKNVYRLCKNICISRKKVEMVQYLSEEKSMLQLVAQMVVTVGKGGRHVYFKVDKDANTLIDFRFKKEV